jgi:hypothetical protein
VAVAALAYAAATRRALRGGPALASGHLGAGAVAVAVLLATPLEFRAPPLALRVLVPAATPAACAAEIRRSPARRCSTCGPPRRPRAMDQGPAEGTGPVAAGAGADGGVDLNNPRLRAALVVVPALAAAPGALTVAWLAAKCSSQLAYHLRGLCMHETLAADSDA